MKLLPVPPVRRFLVPFVLLSSSTALAQEPLRRPPPTSFEYFQYGMAVTTEQVASPGDVCPSGTDTPCILGGGFGPTIRIGRRNRGAWYAGGAYEFSRQDPSNLIRLAILQQLRAEARYYEEAGQRVTPYGMASLGLVGYGNEWGIDTGGIVASLGLGGEFHLSGTAVIGAAVHYRALLLRGWRDSAGQARADALLGFGLAHMVALELAWEIRDPLPR